jgi:hypothetical protein
MFLRTSGCGVKKPFVCEMPPIDENKHLRSQRMNKHKPIPNFRNDQYSCPDGFILLHRSCYRFEADEAQWSRARIACEKWNSHLITISSQAENNWIESYAGNNNFRYLYLGITGILKDKPKELHWERLDSDATVPMYTNWKQPDEPNLGGPGGEDCAVMLMWSGTIGNWYDTPCSSMNAFVCEVGPTKRKE